MKYIDLRSDTVTMQPDFMINAMFKAQVGDDVYNDDPTIKKLESLAADMVGKEAALFVPTGTFGNQLALFTHCNRGDEVILSDSSHIVAHEVGASSVIAGVQLRTIDSDNGLLPPKSLESKIRVVDDIHFPTTSLISIENAHSSGHVIPISNMKETYMIAKKYSIPVHLDGARIFNAAIALDVGVKEITKYCNTIMFCLSKGLCAPAGSILAGSKEFISAARKKRKLMGGGMRQIGFLGAAGIVSLTQMVDRLSEDHDNARLFINELSKVPGITVNEPSILINMVFFKFDDKTINTQRLVKFLLNHNVKINDADSGYIRFVTHYWISKEDVYTVVKLIKQFLNS